MIKRILLGVGGTDYTAVAIERAVELALLHGARLTAVTAVNPDRVCKLGPVPPGASIYARRLCENRLEVARNHLTDSVDELDKKCKQSGIGCEVVWETGDPFELVIKHARYHDLTVFGLRSLFEYQLVEHPENSLIRLLSRGVRPILTVSRQYRPINRVMVAYSGSMESARAMRNFVQHEIWPEVTLDIVHFNEKPDANSSHLDDAAAYCRDHGFQVSTRIFSGKPDEQLLLTARELNADMIVMGNSGRSIWLRKVLGSTFIKTLTQADRPLFISQ